MTDSAGCAKRFLLLDGLNVLLPVQRSSASGPQAVLPGELQSPAPAYRRTAAMRRRP